MWGPEFEFYIFDSIRYANDIHRAAYEIDSREADWNSFNGPQGGDSGNGAMNLGHKIPTMAAITPLRRLMTCPMTGPSWSS